MDKEPRLYHGGLMRCCVETWLDYAKSPQGLPHTADALIRCKYCGAGITRRKDGDWEWEQTEQVLKKKYF